MGATWNWVDRSDIRIVPAGRVAADVRLTCPRVSLWHAIRCLVSPRAWIGLLICSCLLVTSLAQAAETYTLTQPRRERDLSRVTVAIEIGGSLKVVSQEKVRPLKMNVQGKLTYDELMLSDASGAWKLRRYYDAAEAVIKIEQNTTTPKLRDDRRLVHVEFDSARPLLFSPQGHLTREELELLDIPGNTALLSTLYPEQAVAVGEQWSHSPDCLAAILGLDAVSRADVQSTLKSVAADLATVEIGGTVEGAMYGVTTKVEIKARYHYHLVQERMTDLLLLIRENRSIGHVATGVEAVSRFQLVFQPLSQAEKLTGEALDDVELETRQVLSLLRLESVPGRYELHVDRRWHVVDEQGTQLSLRLVDRGDLLAQCNVSALTPVKPGEEMTLSRFQDEIKKALGDKFGEFVEASQGKNALEQSITRVVATGKVDALPIQWHYYLVADSNGRQAILAFTLEPELVERLADADRQLVGTLRFALPAADAAAAPTPAIRK